MRNVMGYRMLLWLLVVPLAAVGCSGPAEPPAKAKAEKPLVVAVCLCKTDSPWRMRMKIDIEAAAKRHDLSIEIMDAQGDAATQQAQLEEALSKRAKLVIVSPADAQSITEPVARLVDAGIPVIVVDRAVIGDKYNCLIAADPKQIGAQAGKWLAQKLQDKGKIMEIEGPVDSLWADDLHAAFRAKLRDPGYHFVFEAHVDPPRADGGTLMAEAMGRIEQIDAVFAHDDAAAYAAYQAAKAAGREKGVLFVGVGGVPDEGEAYVSQGILTATFLIPTGGAEAVDAAARLLRSEQVPKKIVPATRAFSKDSHLSSGEG
jgi:ribose transport system substrate-binding protein